MRAEILKNWSNIRVRVSKKVSIIDGVSSINCRTSNKLRPITSTAQKTKFPIKDFFSKCDQIRSFLRIWSHLLKKSRMENFIFLCSVILQDYKKITTICQKGFIFHKFKLFKCETPSTGKLYIYFVLPY